MSDIKDLQKRVADFIDARDWRQFHDDPKGTLLALGGEVGELLQIYRLLSAEQARGRIDTHREQIEDEVGDILYVLLMFCTEVGINPEAAFSGKLAKLEGRYPIAKFKGVNKKYDQL